MVQGDNGERDEVGKEIFELIKPFILEYDSRLISLVPSRTLKVLRYELEDDEEFMKLFDNLGSDQENLGNLLDRGDNSSFLSQSRDRDS